MNEKPLERLNYYNGPSLQYEFFDRWENLIGAGIWMDY